MLLDLLNVLIKKHCKDNRTSGQDGGIGRHTVPPRTTKRRTTTHLKTKKQPKLIENRTVWKSDNQGVKEETLTQTSRRGGDGQLGGEDSRKGCSWQPVVPHSCADKSGGTNGERDRPHNPGLQHREIKPQTSD